MAKYTDPADIKKAIMAVSANINKQQGEGTVCTMSTADRNIKRWSTKIKDLDEILGGGMPEGRMVEIFGAEGAGKTSLLHHLTALHPYAINIPIEGTFDAARARAFGNTKANLIVCRAKYGEDAMIAMSQYIRTGVPIIGLDSVPSCIPREDVEKLAKAVSKNQDHETRLGGVPRLMGKYLHDLSVQAELFGTTLVFINQIRDIIGATWGETVKTPGGHLLLHAYSVRLKVARRAWIEIPNKNPSVVSPNEKVGIIQKIKVVKSKVGNPMGECEIPMFFDRGYVSWDDVKPIRNELMKKRKEQFGGRIKTDDDDYDYNYEE
jgi:recombination protein RecA